MFYTLHNAGTTTKNPTCNLIVECNPKKGKHYNDFALFREINKSTFYYFYKFDNEHLQKIPPITYHHFIK